MASRWYRSSLKRSWKGTEGGIVEVQWKPRKEKGKRDLGGGAERRQNGKKQSGMGELRETHTYQLPPIWSGILLQCPWAMGRELRWGMEYREDWTPQTELWRLPFCFLPHCAAYADLGAGQQRGKWICRIGRIPSRQEGRAKPQTLAVPLHFAFDAVVEIGEVAGGWGETRGIKGSAPRVFVSGETRSHCSSLAFCQRLSGFNNHKSGLAHALAGSSREENGGGKK